RGGLTRREREAAGEDVGEREHDDNEQQDERQAALGLPVAKTGAHLVGTLISPFGPSTSRISPVLRSRTWPGLSEKRTAPSPRGPGMRPARRPVAMRGASWPSTRGASPFPQPVDGPPERRT